MLINGDLASPKEPEEIPVKPKFMDKFKGTLVVEEGGTLTLTFKVVGVPTPKITWMQGDKVLKPSSRIKMTTSDGDVTIVVKAVTMEEAGIYTCVAENSEGEAFCSATIKVKAKPKAECPKIILKKTRVTAGEGDNVRLEAIVKGEEVKVQWTQDGTLLRDSQETRYERKGETFALVIPLVEKEDSGKYTVEASNEGGKDEATVLLVVKDMSMPARILKKPESTSVLEGEAAAFTCEVEGSPPPTVSWAKDGRLLHDDGRVSLRTEGKTHTLEITKTLISHSADYVCMASNKHGEDNCDFSLTVEELPVPPVFKKTPKDETVEEGKWVKFVCEVDGAPAPEAQWFRGDHLITTTGLCRVRTSSFTPLLEIYSVRVEDAGNYRCIVKNDGGEISCHFKLGVTAKPTSPRITRKPASETVKEDQKVTFTSKVTGYPRPEVTWSKDGRTIQEDERHIIAVDGQTYTLEILSAVFSDEGNWACVARNKRGQDKCIFTLTVQEKPFPPEFVIKPKSTTVEEGSEAVFDVQVDGEPQPKVTWVKDDEEIVHTRKRQIIDDGDRHSLVIPSAAVSDAGNYICKVTNSEGEVSCDFNFNVNRKPCPPEFLTKPRSGIIDEGTNHSFECELGGEPLPVVTWHKEGKQLSQDDRIRIRTEENKAFLSLLPTEMADSGKWSIIAKNVRGQKKYEFTLSIREVPVPPEFVKSPESITIDEGEAAEFACEITGKPAPMVNWYKDSTQVKQDARHTVSADGTVYSLDIKPALITDKGNYKVVARGANEQQTSEFKLTVREKFSPPTFPSAPKDITADVGKPIKVTVEIKGEPKPSVKWTKKDKKTKVLEGGDGYSITSSGNKYTLEILCADFKDSAEYTIEASNIRGSVSKSFKINVVEVKVPPEFLSKPEDQTVMEGESVEFSCEVEGDPEPQVIWSKDSHPLHEGGQFSITTVDFSSTLEIDNVTLDNKGTYTCTIRNKHGEKKCTVTLNVDERPFPPEFLEPPASQTVEEGKSAKFTCEVDGEPAPKVSWEKDGQTLKKGKRYKISGDEFSSTLEIPTVLSTDGGSYACVLENAEGTITEEFNLMVQEGEQHKEITQDQLQSLLSSIDSGSTEDTDMFYSIDEASPPEFKSELNNIVCKEDEEVVFSCTVHGAPDPEITWYKDGKSIKPSKYFQMSYDGETAELTLDGAFPEDSGVYTCTARNPAGDVSKSAKLTVEELESPLKRSMSEEEDVTAGPSPPKFSQALQDEVCERNSIAQLTCKVSGNPKPRVTWMKGDTVLTEGDRYEIFEEKGSFNMEIYDTLPSDSGTYTCVASNAHGTVKCSAELLIADGDELEAAEENREGMFARKPLPHEDEEEEEEISSEGTVNTVTESHAFSEDQEVRSARVPSVPAPVRRVPPPESTPDDASPVGSRAPHGTGVAAKGVVSADDDEPVLHAGGLAKPTKPATKPKWPRAQKGPTHARVVVLDESSGRLDLDNSDEPEDSEVHAGKVLFATERGKASDIGSSSQIKPKPTIHDQDSFVHSQPKHQKQQLLTPSNTSSCQDTHIHASLSEGGRRLERPELHRVDREGASKDFHTDEDSVDHTSTDNDRVVVPTAGSGDSDADLDTRNAAKSKKLDSELRRSKSKDLDLDIDTVHEVYDKPSRGLRVSQKSSLEESATKADIDNESKKQVDTESNEYPKSRRTANGAVDRQPKPEKEDDELRTPPADNLEIELESQNEVYPKTKSDHKPETIAGLRMTTKLEEEEYPQMVHTNDLEIHMSAQRETYPKPAKATIITDRTAFAEATKSAGRESENGLDLKNSKALREEESLKPTDDLEVQIDSEREVYPTRITQKTKLEEEEYLPKSSKPTDDLDIQLESEQEIYPTRVTPKTSNEESTKSLDIEPERCFGIRTKLEEEDFPQKSIKPNDDLEIQLESEQEIYPTRVTPKTSYEESTKSLEKEPERGVGLRTSTKLEEEEYPKKSSQPIDDLDIQLDSEKEVYPTRITPKTTYEESRKSTDDKPENGYRASTKLEEEEYPQKSAKPEDDLGIQLDSEKEVYPTRITPKTTYEESRKSTDDKPENGYRASTKLEEEEYPQKSAKPEDDLGIQLDSEKEVYPTRITPKTTYDESAKSADKEPERGVGLRTSTKLEEEEYPKKSSQPKDDLEIQLDSEKEVHPTRTTPKTRYEESAKSTDDKPENGYRASTKLEEEEYPQKSSEPKDDLEIQLDSQREVYPTKITQRSTYEESTKSADKEPERGVSLKTSTKLEEEEYPKKSSQPKDDLKVHFDSKKEVCPTRITPKTTYEESAMSTDDKPENSMGSRASTELEEEEYPQKSSEPKDDLEIQLDSQREVYPTRITQRSTYEESTKSAEDEPKRGVGLRMSTKLEEEEYPQKSSKPTDVTAQVETDREEFPPSAAGIRISQKSSYEESTAHKDVPDVLKPDHDLEIQRKSDKEEAKTKTTPQPSAKPGIKQKSDYAESSRGTPDHGQQKEDSVEDEPDVSSMKGRILQDEPSTKTQRESDIQTTVSPKPQELAKGTTAITTDLETEDKFEDAEESQVPSSPSLSGKRFTPLGRESITDAATFKVIAADADKSSSTVSTPSVLDETELHDEDLSPYVSADEEQTTSGHHVQHIPTTPSDHVTSLPSSESESSHLDASAITPSTSQSEDGEVSVTFKGKQEPLSGKGQGQTDIGVSFEQQREPSLIHIRAKGKIETQELRTDMPTVGSLEGQEISFQIKGDGGKMEIVGLPQLAAGKARSSKVISIALPSSDEESTSFLEPKSVREKRLQLGRAKEADSRGKPSYYDSGESSEELESSTDVQALFKEPMQRRTSGELIFDSRERMMQKAETVLSSLAEKGLQQVAKIRSERAKERRIDDTDGHKLLDDEVARAMREEAKPAEVNVAVGQRVELKADIPGNPRIRWLHNGMEVSDTKFSKYLTTGDLHVLALSKVGPEHAGVFTCEATTPDGIVTCDIIIKVEEPKEPPETPKTQVKEGHRVELKAEIPDSRRIEWLLDGKLIRETEDRRYTSFGNMHSLTIISVKPEDAGTYTCVAMTPRGEVTCNIKLEVEKSSNQEVIKMVEMDQSLQAQELKLPEEPCTQPTTLDVLEGQEVTLRAEVPVSPSHHPTVLPIDDADVTWLFNDKEISNTESIAVSATNHTSTLTIRKVQREFEGTYTCIATTPHGTGRCQIILHIIPSSPPNVTSSMRKQTVRTQELTFRVPMLLMERSTAPGTIDIQEGQELNIRAEIPGKPDITWLFNGKELKASDEVQFGVDKDVYMLTVTKVTRHWSGTFTCIAKTPSGKTVCDIVVNVKEATDQHLEMEKTLETEGAEVQMQQWRLRSPVQTTQATPAVAQFEVKEGQEVTLRAEIPGQADIMWMFEGKELSESDNISFSSDGDVHILKINNVTSDFSGKFTCVAKTDHGAATCDILLTVGPPTLTQKTTELLQIQRPAAQTPPQFFEVKEGQEVNLRAEVPGSKSVKWSFNGKELSKSDQLTFFSEYDIHTLRITKVTKEWAGTFTCSAATETGETTCDIVLSIKDSDLALRGDRTESRIAKEMQVTSQVVRKDTGASTEVTVKEGQEVTLQAGIPGNYIIKWLHGGKLLPDSAAFKQMTKGDLHILTIPKIKREHAGTYTCQATSGTTTVKCDIIVHVTEQERLVPPDFKIKPRSQRVEKGGTVSLISEVSGEPKPSVSWLKDGKEVLETSRITTRHVGKNYILEISDAGEEDSGSYTCVGTNAAGQYSCTATLHVYDELIGGYHIAGNGSALATTNVGTVTSTHVEVPEGQQVSLQATLPEPIPGDDVKWMYNGEELNPSTLYKQSTRGTTHTLTINRVSKQQEGTYTCEATGPTGVSKCDLVITVLPKKKEMVPPDFVSQPKPATVDDGESVEFCCQITGDPQPEVHWLKNGQELCGWTASRTFVTSSSTAGGSTSRPSVRGTPSAWTVSRLATQESSSAWQPTPEGSAPAQFRFT
ncbi:muscle M-line assembly protein unc-89-like isoform X4 [Branchiostoma lanceolatum]|uniref:muscle M-line assembly protein unc-89-like isoform X4 n=1 Tax=Branchiostoma lanceolatum TaxID=7740 RepID=UPI003451EAB2